MDSVTVRSALEKAKLIVLNHGMVAHMSPYNKGNLERGTVADDDDSLSFEFVLDPSKSSWDDSNCRLTLTVQYRSSGDVMLNGDRVRHSARHIRFHWNSGMGTVELLTSRESMISNLMLLNELLVVALPEKVSRVVQTAAQIEAEKKAELDRLTAHHIAHHIGKDAMRGLRTGGRSRTVYITPEYLQNSPSVREYPAVGTYVYEQIRRTDRRGRVKESVRYSFRVMHPAGVTAPAVLVRRV